MKEKRVFYALGGVNDKFIAELYEPGQTNKQMTGSHPPIRVWLIAAIIAAMVFLMGCAIVYVLSLEDMAFGSKVQEYYDGSTEEVTLLSLQGIQGTPGYQATKEWYEWLETYDTDGAVWDSHEAYGADFGDDIMITVYTPRK